MANELFAGLLGQPESLHCSNRTVGRQPHPKMSDSYPSMLPDGTLFQDRYSVVRCIKAGGMGAVYEVVHLETQRHRALKVMLPQLVANEQMRARFKQEATVAAQVESQHIVEVIVLERARFRLAYFDRDGTMTLASGDGKERRRVDLAMCPRRAVQMGDALVVGGEAELVCVAVGEPN